ncbi:MAG: alanine/glycine:cation symporter family protein [Bacteroidales bacterium]|nr:alanine/glycine:cation symporter family protein [Bacteroidales bacterium]
MTQTEAISLTERIITGFSDLAWGTPLLVLLLGGGLFFLLYSRMLPFRYFRHAFAILLGRYDDPDEPGQINHYQALSTALAATVGMGNITGVALAITMGGPGAIFWMWVSALLGVSTKYFTCTLAILFRGRDSNGVLQGGPMYVIVEGLGRHWRPLAVFFSLLGMIGVLPMFQVNQLTQVVRDVVLIPNAVAAGFTSDLISGLIVALLVGVVIFGGIKRIGKVSGRMVPLMVALYVLLVLYIIFSNPSRILPSFALIFRDAFSAQSVLGGSVGALVITGVRRAAFSNEAGIGTAPMAHGAAKTNEPVREGLVAMLGPVVDTIIVCTMTALALIVTGVWNAGQSDGITMTADAFEQAMPGVGPYLLTICVAVFSISTMLSFPYYGSKCFSFIFGAKHSYIYKWFYLATIPLGATATLGTVVGIFDGAYALMAFPTMISALWLSPHVLRASKDYFRRLKKESSHGKN